MEKIKIVFQSASSEIKVEKEVECEEREIQSLLDRAQEIYLASELAGKDNVSLHISSEERSRIYDGSIQNGNLSGIWIH